MYKILEKKKWWIRYIIAYYGTQRGEVAHPVCGLLPPLGRSVLRVRGVPETGAALPGRFRLQSRESRGGSGRGPGAGGHAAENAGRQIASQSLQTEQEL
ncbi:hypothetical protein CEXT_554501 [Caerostris extrusa]|uniref:Uncharacterized protein n=1 Tax=Caerostris extrusa TaxID=172846 RepID=A0AAV4NGJ1_CAEEX|nr:hypothetical protein CEXT_554501 [Caerostris extrusa]